MQLAGRSGLIGGSTGSSLPLLPLTKNNHTALRSSIPANPLFPSERKIQRTPSPSPTEPGTYPRRGRARGGVELAERLADEHTAPYLTYSASLQPDRVPASQFPAAQSRVGRIFLNSWTPQ